MTRRGRPRKVGKALQAAISRDHGTPELIAKRMAIVGETGDPTLSTCPLDALLARKFITQDIFNDASDYERWFTLSARRGVISSSGGSASNDETSDKTLIEARQMFDRATKILMGISRQAKDAVDNAVVYKRWPNCLIESRRTKSDRHLFQGLAALSAWRRGERRAA